MTDDEKKEFNFGADKPGEKFDSGKAVIFPQRIPETAQARAMRVERVSQKVKDDEIAAAQMAEKIKNMPGPGEGKRPSNYQEQRNMGEAIVEVAESRIKPGESSVEYSRRQKENADRKAQENADRTVVVSRSSKPAKKKSWFAGLFG